MNWPLELEVAHKLAQMRGWLEDQHAGAVRLRGVDWFAWATAGASNSHCHAAESGCAEVLVTRDAAYVLTDEAEALQGYWARLGEGGQVVIPLRQQMWGDEYGQLVDRFGIIWHVNIAGSAG